METKLLTEKEEDLLTAAGLLKKGEVVGIPTETVYGLAADAYNESAVAKIFAAKGRPQDNPLIVHIAAPEALDTVAENIPEIARKLAEKFWPGPLTMVLPKKKNLPMATSGGLDTVGVRMPSHSTARKIIELSGTPLAAPSANLSGSPSPTTASHVMEDMNGRIPAVVDGGACTVGVESTVISFEGEAVRILRPGFITPEDLGTIADSVITDKGVLEKMDSNQKVRSPGMKYKHYSPMAHVIMVEGDFDSFSEYVAKNYHDGVYAMVFNSDKGEFGYPCIAYGDTEEEHARMLFQKLREIDKIGADTVYVRSPEKKGVGLAVYNRLIRAAGFEVVKL